MPKLGRVRDGLLRGKHGLWKAVVVCTALRKAPFAGPWRSSRSVAVLDRDALRNAQTSAPEFRRLLGQLRKRQLAAAPPEVRVFKGLVVAIPSMRIGTIAKVIAMWRSAGVPPRAIYVFVRNKTVASAYKEICTDAHVVVGKAGLLRQRRFIESYFPSNTHVVSCDDDVAAVYMKTGRFFRKLQEDELVRLVLRAQADMRIRLICGA